MSKPKIKALPCPFCGGPAKTLPVRLQRGETWKERAERAEAALAAVTAERDAARDSVKASEAEAEHFIQAAIDRAPEPMRRLGEWLSRVLDEDTWQTADRMLLGAIEAHAAALAAEREKVRRAEEEAEEESDACLAALESAKASILEKQASEDALDAELEQGAQAIYDALRDSKGYPADVTIGQCATAYEAALGVAELHVAHESAADLAAVERDIAGYLATHTSDRRYPPDFIATQLLAAVRATLAAIRKEKNDANDF